MVEEYRPLDFPPNWVYGPDFWNVVNQDIFLAGWNTLIYGFTGKIPPPPYLFHMIKWCGNPDCHSQIVYIDKIPSNCESCRVKIKWE
jgi:hypothetical protein